LTFEFDLHFDLVKICLLYLSIFVLSVINKD
jgi:hypothetical protein